MYDESLSGDSSEKATTHGQDDLGRQGDKNLCPLGFANAKNYIRLAKPEPMNTAPYHPDETRITLTIPTGFTRFKYGATVSYAIAVLLFFLPFLTIRCNDVKLASATGIHIATGFKVEPGKQLEQMGGLFGDEKRRQAESAGYSNDDEDYFTDEKPAEKPASANTVFKKETGGKTLGANYFMAGAFILGLAGALISLVPFRQRWLFCVIAGWGGIIAFIITIVSVLQQTKQYRINLGMLKLSVNFTFWFFLSFLAVIIALLYSYKQKDMEWMEGRRKELEEYMNNFGYGTEPVTAETS
jgi:hypothetical protein